MTDFPRTAKQKSPSARSSADVNWHRPTEVSGIVLIYTSLGFGPVISVMQLAEGKAGITGPY